MKCPKNHVLPNIIGGVSCAPDQCAEDNVPMFAPTKKIKEKPPNVNAAKALASSTLNAVKKATIQRTNDFLEEALEGTDAMWAAKQDFASERVSEIAKLGRRIGKSEALKVYTKTPDAAGMSQEERKAYVDKKLDELTVDAIARVEFDLKLGDDDVSRKMALEVLDRTGYGKKEALAQAGAPIIIVNQGGEPYRPPWERVVDAKK